MKELNTNGKESNKYSEQAFSGAESNYGNNEHSSFTKKEHNAAGKEINDSSKLKANSGGKVANVSDLAGKSFFTKTATIAYTTTATIISTVLIAVAVLATFSYTNVFLQGYSYSDTGINIELMIEYDVVADTQEDLDKTDFLNYKTGIYAIITSPDYSNSASVGVKSYRMEIDNEHAFKESSENPIPPNTYLVLDYMYEPNGPAKAIIYYSVILVVENVFESKETAIEIFDSGGQSLAKFDLFN